MAAASCSGDPRLVDRCVLGVGEAMHSGVEGLRPPRLFRFVALGFPDHVEDFGLTQAKLSPPIDVDLGGWRHPVRWQRSTGKTTGSKNFVKKARGRGIFVDSRALLLPLFFFCV